MYTIVFLNADFEASGIPQRNMSFQVELHFFEKITEAQRAHFGKICAAHEKS